MKIYIATASKFSGSPEKAELELKKAKVHLKVHQDILTKLTRESGNSKKDYRSIKELRATINNLRNFIRESEEYIEMHNGVSAKEYKDLQAEVYKLEDELQEAEAELFVADEIIKIVQKSGFDTVATDKALKLIHPKAKEHWAYTNRSVSAIDRRMSGLINSVGTKRKLLRAAKVKLGNLKKANKDKLFANRRPAKRIPTRIPK